MAKKKDDVLNEFTTLPGVGLSKARVLYNCGYESLEALERTSLDELMECKGVNEKLAGDIYTFLHPDGEPEEMKSDDKTKKSKIPAKKKSEIETLVDQGIDLHKRGKWGQALQSLNEALRLDPVNNHALLARGDIYLEREKFEKALESFEVLIEINPKNDKAWVKYGDTLMIMDRQSEAMACYKKALDIDSENEQARDRLAENATLLGGHFLLEALERLAALGLEGILSKGGAIIGDRFVGALERFVDIATHAERQGIGRVELKGLVCVIERVVIGLGLKLRRSAHGVGPHVLRVELDSAV